MSNLLSNLRVAVIGGGISGVATAASLFKVGCKRVTVYDKQPSLSALHSSHAPAAVLQANGTRVLDALDLLPSLSSSAAPIHRITQRNARGDLLSSFSPSTFLHARTKDGRALTSLAAGYSDLHSAIAASLPSSALQWGREVQAVERGESGYAISFSSSSEVRADLIVAADGEDSTIRSNFVYGRASLPQVMGGVIVEGVSRGAVWEEQRDNELLEVWGNGQRVGAVRLLDGDVYWYATVNESYADAASSPDSFAAALSSLPTWVTKLVAATPSTSYLVGPLRHLPPSAPLYRDGVVLVGSASELLPPDLHQQVASSLESALTLALSLRSSPTIAGALQRYSSARMPRLSSLHTSSLSECQQAIQKSKLMSSLRDMASSLMPAQVKDAVMETAIGFDVLKHFPEYRDGAVADTAAGGAAGQAAQAGSDKLDDVDDMDEEEAEELRQALKQVEEDEAKEREEEEQRRKKGGKR